MKPAEKDSWSPTSLLIRLMVAGTVLAIWFWTQSLLGARTAPETGVADALHNLTAGWNAYLAHHAAAANVLLILSSAIIDALGVFLLGSWLFGRSRSEEHTSELQSLTNLVCRLLLEKKKQIPE